ncbi:MAG TPA: hypothetical protein VJ746_00120 [Nitrospira sp.]|nr:hypothetical protein [Nitrospira sp.]
MSELEVKAQTRLTGRTHAIGTSTPPVTCAVDECLHKAAAQYEVTVTNDQLAPESETHSVPLCETHAKSGDALKWEWRRTKDAPSGQRLKLEALFAMDTIEDRQHS